MRTVKTQAASKTNKSSSFCQPVEALENRQMMSTVVPHIPALLPAVQSDLHVHADQSQHAAKGNGLLTTQITKVQVIYTPIYRPITFFVEPKVDSAVTQWQNFSSDPLFAAGGPSPKDVAQGQVGDCWFLATLAETALRDPSTITNSIHQRTDGTYDVLFHTSTTSTLDEHVDGKLPENAYGGLEYAKLGQSNCTWVPIMEKAFTYFRNRNIAAAYSTISNGWGSESMADLGATPSELLPKVATASELFTDVVWGLIFNTGMDLGIGGAAGPLVNDHEYSVVSARVQNGVNQIEVRNPWGYNPNYTHNSNYNATNDGYMWVNASAVFGQLDEFVSAAV